MSVGMPGAAVGGLFYIVSAICMPVHASVDHLRGARSDTARWRDVARQAAIALGIVAVTWLVGVMVALLLGPASQPSAPAAPPASHLAALPATAVLQQVAVVLSLGTLAAILVGVQVLRLVVRLPAPPGVASSVAAVPVPAPHCARVAARETTDGATPMLAPEPSAVRVAPASESPADESLVCARG